MLTIEYLCGRIYYIIIEEDIKMSKCKNCGTEYEGNFCPNCGQKNGPVKCKNCGAEFEGNFCPNCGESAGYTCAPSKEAGYGKFASAAPKIYAALGLAPSTLLLLFAALTFLFFLAPVASVEGESLGNVYSLNGGILAEIPEAKGALIFMIVFAAIALTYAAAAAVLSLSRYRFALCKLFGKVDLPLRDVAVLAGGAVVYLVDFIIGCVIAGKVGGELLGACAVLMIVFSFLFAILCAGAEVAKFFTAKKFPACKEKEESQRREYAEAREAQKREYSEALKQYIALLEAPAKPELGVKLREKMQKKGWSGEKASSKYLAAARRRISAACILTFIGFAYLLLTAAGTQMRGGPILVIAVIFFILCVLISLLLVFMSQTVRYYFSMKKFNRRNKKYEAGENYKGRKAFEKWLAEYKNIPTENGRPTDSTL